MGHRKRNRRPLIKIVIDLNSLKRGLFVDGTEIEWARLVDKKLAMDVFGNITIGKEPKRYDGDVGMLIKKNGDIDIIDILPVNKRTKKIHILKLTHWQYEAMATIQNELEKQGLIKKTEFPDSKNMSILFAAALFSRQEK